MVEGAEEKVEVEEGKEKRGDRTSYTEEKRG